MDDFRETRRAGQPVVVLALILILWIGARAAFWSSPFLPAVTEAVATIAEDGQATMQEIAQVETFADVGAHSGARPKKSRIWERTATAGAHSSEIGKSVPARQPTPSYARKSSGVGITALTAAMTKARPAEATAFPLAGESLIRTPSDRWSLDAWAFIRENTSNRLNPGAIPATYGASQAGAILRYRLNPADDRHPTAYLRATSALGGPSQKEIAAGVSIRPFPKVPITTLGEIRAAEFDGSVEARPAILAVTEFSPIALPAETRATVYGQAGYVAGDFATAFADGLIRIDREVASASTVKLRFGGGVWGGAQRGAERIDIGPTISADVPAAGGSLRVSLDYRHRVTGDAVPQSGFAFTVSTGL